MMTETISEEEYWKRRNHIESQKGGGHFWCNHVWISVIQGSLVSVRFIRDHGEIAQTCGIPNLKKCVKCGKQKTTAGGLKGLRGEWG